MNFVQDKRAQKISALITEAKLLSLELPASRNTSLLITNLENAEDKLHRVTRGE